MGCGSLKTRSIQEGAPPARGASGAAAAVGLPRAGAAEVVGSASGPSGAWESKAEGIAEGITEEVAEGSSDVNLGPELNGAAGTVCGCGCG